jgi:hypothetical protein
MEQSAVQHCPKPAPQRRQLERVSHSELNLVRRPIIIGSVNVIASATLAYAGQVSRMTRPATVTTLTQTTSPTTTPSVRLAMKPS